MLPKAIKTLTIGRLATAANVGVETIRYYQKLELLPVPPRQGSYRQYPISIVTRIRFIKRAQDLGFTLKEISSLLELQDGANRVSIRSIARDRIAQIESKLIDLQRMHEALSHLLHVCKNTHADIPCPIIESLIDAQNED